MSVARLKDNGNTICCNGQISVVKCGCSISLQYKYLVDKGASMCTTRQGLLCL
jgi:hypothetical protein